MTRRLLAVLAYMLPTFPLGYFWHLTIFADYYKNLQIYRDELLIPMGFLAMLIQAIVWAVIYENMFAGLPVSKGAMRFFSLAFPLSFSFQVLAVGAKHRMSSVADYALIETAFIAIHFAVVSPLIAWVYRTPLRTSQT
jgi:phosphate/sulfate permease